MKLKNLILTGLLASAAYKLYQNRDQVAATVTDTKAALSEGQATLSQTQSQLQTLKAQTADLQKTKDSLAYKFRVFKEEAQPHLDAIKDTLDAYGKDDYIF